MGDWGLVFPELVQSEQNRVFLLVELGIDMVGTEEEEEEERNGFEKKDKGRKKRRRRHVEKMMKCWRCCLIALRLWRLRKILIIIGVWELQLKV